MSFCNSLRSHVRSIKSHTPVRPQQKHREMSDSCMHFGQSEPSSLSVTMGRLFVGTSGWCGLHPKDFARHYDVVRAPGEPMGAGDARR